MVSRRRVLQMGMGALTATAGCLDEPSESKPNTSSGGTDDGGKWTPSAVSEWTPEWTMPFDDWQVLGLDTADGLLYATLSKDNGPSAVAAVNPEEQSVLWQTESEGEAVNGSYASYQGISRGQWGVTMAGDTVYAVAGPAEERQWSALHAFDRTNGDRRWSLQRERELAVAGTADGLVVATGLEFFPPPKQTEVTHQTPESPLSTVVYGLDANTGTVRWSREFVEVQDVTVAENGVYVARGDRLVGLEKDGTTRFTYERGSASGVKAAADRIFYLAGEDATATLHGITTSGDRDWQLDAPVEELLLDGDRLYAGGDAVVAVEADGTVAWRDTDYGKWLLLDPDRDALYTRGGDRSDAATAYDVTGTERWTFDPPTANAWPETATEDALVVSAINEGSSDKSFLTVYAVNPEGEATAAIGKETIFDGVGLDRMVYLADGASNLVAMRP